MSGVIIFVRSAGAGEPVPVEVAPSASIKDIIEEYARITDRSTGGIQLAQGTVTLGDEALLADLGIGTESTLCEVGHLIWHPDHLPSSGGDAPRHPVLLKLEGPGTEAGGAEATATSSRPGEHYTSPIFTLMTHKAIMYFGLVAGVPDQDIKYNSSCMLLLVNCNSTERFVSGQASSDGEVSLGACEDSPFRFTIDPQYRISYILSYGSPSERVVPATDATSKRFAEAVAEHGAEHALHPYVGSWCPAGGKWGVSL
eukprot:TRINITY_DN13781_c0_g1_i2.p1 TRINITY_DN13781_c0_g1~~TRINITY_DN13781_c0_g1_i2.p1  ORF type:complete len:299 (+),score=72.00 TRINITY_DN13781_c0_g1_i2:132-899(+)